MLRALGILGTLFVMQIIATGAASQVWSAEPSSLVPIIYGFVEGSSGGVAVIEVDVLKRQLSKPRPLFTADNCSQPLKVRCSADRRTIVCTNVAPQGPHLFVWHDNAPNAAQAIMLPSIPDEVRIVGSTAIVSCDGNQIVFVDLTHDEIEFVDEIEKSLSPPGNAPEDIQVTPDGQWAIVSCQKDNKNGSKRGNRLVVYEIATHRHAADLELPRERPDLHLANNQKEQGPGPEVVLLSAEHDLLLTTLDLYGALGMLRWSAAQHNELADWAMLSTATDASWGNAFPDRATLVRLNGHDYALVFNAGSRGGCVLIDLASKQVAWRHAVPPGMERPLFFEANHLAVTVCSGKTKRRVADEIDKTSTPQQSVYCFQFGPPNELANSRVQSVHMPGFTHQIASVPAANPLALVACGQDALVPDTFVLFDPMTLSIVSMQRAHGVVQRCEER